MDRATVYVRGRVQGVGFRWWVRAQAAELGLGGRASNLPDGRVEVVAEGPGEAVLRLVQLIEESPSTTRRPGEVRATETDIETDVQGRLHRGRGAAADEPGHRSAFLIG